MSGGYGERRRNSGLPPTDVLTNYTFRKGSVMSLTTKQALIVKLRCEVRAEKTQKREEG